MSILKKILLSMPGFQGLCRYLTRWHVRVLMYHRFRADEACGGGLRASVFREQLRLILARHPVWTTEQQFAARASKSVTEACPVVITTDDGYRDYYDVAYPILRELGVCATLFVTTGFVDGTVWMWWDKLRYLADHAPQVALELKVAELPISLDFSDYPTREASIRFLINRSRFIPDQEKHAMLEHLSEALQVAIPDRPPAAMSAVNWDHVREMHGHGMVFAPHSVTHPILTRITAEQVDSEIRGSRDRLAAILGDSGRVFAYPQGGPSDFDPDVSRRVAAAGFEACYLAYQGPGLDDDALQLPRYCPGECMTAFQWALCGAEFIVNRIRRTLGMPIGPGERYWYGQDLLP